jgi:hypothetical protein
MAVLSTAYPTLLDIAKRSGSDGRIMALAETMSQLTEMLDVIPWVEANDGSSHKSSIRASIPTPTWRLFNKGVVQVKTTSNQFVDACGMMENYSTVDKDLADLNGNTAAWRLSEDTGIIEGMNQEFLKVLAYGDTTVNPEKFVGLAPRYYQTSTTNNPAGTNVILGGGSGSVNASMYLIGLSPETVFGIYPKGSQAGLRNKDLGEQTVYDASNNPYQAYRTHYKWDCGLVVKDWRFVIRIANIDMTNLKTASDGTDTSANITKLMMQAIEKLPRTNGVIPVWMTTRTVRAMLRVKLMNKGNTFVTVEDWTGASGITRKQLMFQGFPVFANEQLLETESTLS